MTLISGWPSLRQLMGAINNAPRLLAYVQYHPASNFEYQTSSDNYEDVDATNLKITFTVPPSGKVRVVLGAQARCDDNADVHWCLREGTTNVPNSRRLVTTAQKERFTMVPIYLTGLTPGQTKTYKWGWRKFGFEKKAYLATGPDDWDGPAIMEVWSVV